MKHEGKIFHKTPNFLIIYLPFSVADSEKKEKISPDVINYPLIDFDISQFAEDQIQLQVY